MIRGLCRLLGVIAAILLLVNVFVHNYPVFRRCHWAPGAQIRIMAFGDPQITGTSPTTAFRKRLDVAGNDYFLAHTVRTMRRHLDPRVSVVLGDLISSQWIDTAEFHARADRFERIFPPRDNEILFNVSGNHDIGYHGEMTSERVDRFEERYGPLNFVRDFDGSWRFVVVNSLALDGAEYGPYQAITHAFLKHLRETPYDGQTVLAIHVPMYKPAGMCRDGPMFKYYEGAQIRSQNHLTFSSTQQVLQSVFANGKPGFVLAGHDHEGCLTSYVPSGSGEFSPVAGLDPSGIQEATVRSLMGEYGGNTGLLSGLYNEETRLWDFEYMLCPFFVQHLWWVATGASYVGLLALSVVPLGVFSTARVLNRN
ncbi:Protein TED1 [Wickerhamiella sorbophila]|uniref:Protein TED1 n=1 Tax=Wickerhamiella sorbophila TaxID=45607 RepID=A0A2T0FP84_9ASCO|nr:Protein TED1 [Wickerhamiella sorbophila]PRT56795.1 Protein TED1 [Wickerhamiella sorbophila]